jgi:hypothetical protein
MDTNWHFGRNCQVVTGTSVLGLVCGFREMLSLLAIACAQGQIVTLPIIFDWLALLRSFPLIWNILNTKLLKLLAILACMKCTFHFSPVTKGDVFEYVFERFKRLFTVCSFFQKWPVVFALKVNLDEACWNFKR